MTLIILLSLIYIIGFNISYWMLSTEIKAEGAVFTIGDRVVCLLLSLGSWGAVTWALVASWIGRIQRTGYWNKPVEQEKIQEVGVVAGKVKATNGVKPHVTA
jgi:hypothetical protein